MRRLFRFAKETMPRISKTERIALRSGTVGIEREAFAGTLSGRSLERYRVAPLSADDRAMLDAAPALLRTVDDHAVFRERHTPPSAPFWDHAKAHGFFGLIVPKAYGGVGMTPTGLSRLLQRLASCSPSAQVHVMVPASLGPAELLVHYGTEAQKQRFLPQLARGAIPCFALTSADAGSDAAGSMTDVGRVVRDAGGVKIVLDCEKRYITLAPVADLIGVAFKLADPDGLLEQAYGRRVDGEITLALLERGRAGLEVGPHTDPLGIGFANGTVVARGVELTVADVIGEERGLGEGWKFLMEALAAGRGIALPAGACGSSKMLTNAVSGYAAVRRQFKVPIAAFEGVREKLADMALKTLEIDALVALMNAVLASGERPPILSAILKQRTTELGRDVVMHAMDVVAGSAICMGPQNFVAPAYLSSPVGITVEGSNTMTRSLLIFGQGLVRSHPHLLDVIDALEREDERAFARAVRAIAATNARLLLLPGRRSGVERFVHFFALSANASLALGGSLKKREYLSGRYADLLSFVVAQHAVEWHAAQVDVPPHLVEAFRTANLHRLQATAGELVRNHPHAALHALLYRRCVGGPARFAPLDDAQREAVVHDLLRADGATRRLFAEDVLELHPNVQRIGRALRTECDEERARLRDEIVRVDTFCYD